MIAKREQFDVEADATDWIEADLENDKATCEETTAFASLENFGADSPEPAGRDPPPTHDSSSPTDMSLT